MVLEILMHKNSKKIEEFFFELFSVWHIVFLMFELFIFT